MKNIKARIAAIRKMAAYGPTPLEEGILSLIEDLTDVNEQQEPDLTKATPEAEVVVTTDAQI